MSSLMARSLAMREARTLALITDLGALVVKAAAQKKRALDEMLIEETNKRRPSVAFKSFPVCKPL